MHKRYKDDADWSGTSFTSTDVGASGLKVRRELNGYLYCTKAEYQLACILTAKKVPFTPDISFPLSLPQGQPRIFVPDFIFNGHMFIWRGQGKRVACHGFEAKGRGPDGKFSQRAQENVELLYSLKKINVFLFSNELIEYYYLRCFSEKHFTDRFPLHRLEYCEPSKR